MGQREHLSEVPPLVGLPAVEAHDRALDARLLAVDSDPTHTSTEPGTVMAQDPAPGSKLPVGQRVLIWVQNGSGGDEGGGGGGGGKDPRPVTPVPVEPAGTK